MKGERKEAGMKHEKRRETVSVENKEAFHAAVRGFRAQDLPKKKK